MRSSVSPPGGRRTTPGAATLVSRRARCDRPAHGALLLVAISGCTALGVTSGPGLALVVAAVVVMIVVHVVVPPLGLGIRRALVTPIILVAGGFLDLHRRGGG